jgi:hypothetical protein
MPTINTVFKPLNVTANVTVATQPKTFERSGAVHMSNEKQLH